MGLCGLFKHVLVVVQTVSKDFSKTGGCLIVSDLQLCMHAFWLLTNHEWRSYFLNPCSNFGDRLTARISSQNFFIFAAVFLGLPSPARLSSDGECSVFILKVVLFT